MASEPSSAAGSASSGGEADPDEVPEGDLSRVFGDAMEEIGQGFQNFARRTSITFEKMVGGTREFFDNSKDRKSVV